MEQPRVVSLLPAATEIMAEIGLAHLLVGRSHECDFPPGVGKLPECTRSLVVSEGDSRAINDSVRLAEGRGLSLYEVDGAKLRSLRPSVILTQAQCDVCAVSDEEVRRALGVGLEGVELVSLAPRRFADIWATMFNVASAVGGESAALTAVRRLKQRVANVIERAIPIPRKPTVACLEWLDPLMGAGNWVPEMVELGGGVPLFGVAGRHSPWIEWEAVQEANPDVIILVPCGFGIPKTRFELPALFARPGWGSLAAVRKKRVFMVDGNQYFNRPGPRLVDSLEILAAILHPSVFNCGHAGWEQVATN